MHTYENTPNPASKLSHSREFDAPIKVGSKVILIDGSWCLSILNGSKELKHNFEGVHFEDEILTVIAVNVPCPSDNTPLPQNLSCMNNCILVSDNNDVIFCSKINIRNTQSFL